MPGVMCYKLINVSGNWQFLLGKRGNTGVWLLLLLAGRVSGDRRCLLEGGGSTDTLFVREDSRVGEEIGRIRVEGNS